MTANLDAEFAAAWAALGSCDPELHQIAKLFFIAGTIFGIERAAQLDREAILAAVDAIRNRIDTGA